MTAAEIPQLDFFGSVWHPVSGSLHLQLAEAWRYPGSTSQLLRLPPGVVDVMVSWSGTEPIQVRHYIGPSTWRVIATIPSRPTVEDRRSGPLRVQHGGVHNLGLVNLAPSGSWSSTSLNLPHSAGTQVIASPPPQRP